MRKIRLYESRKISVNESTSFMAREKMNIDKILYEIKDIDESINLYSCIDPNSENKDKKALMPVDFGHVFDKKLSYILSNGENYLYLDFDENGNLNGADRYGNNYGAEDWAVALGMISEHDEEYHEIMSEYGEETDYELMISELAKIGVEATEDDLYDFEFSGNWDPKCTTEEYMAAVKKFLEDRKAK